MNYPLIIKTTPEVLVEFYTDWCPHCRRMRPVADELTEELGDRVNFFTIDVDRHRDVADEVGLRTFPTFILYRRGREVWRGEGEMSKLQILENLTTFAPK